MKKALSQAVSVTKNEHFLKQINPETLTKKSNFFGGRACLSIYYVLSFRAERRKRSKTLRKPSNVPFLTVIRRDDPSRLWPSDNDDDGGDEEGVTMLQCYNVTITQCYNVTMR